MDNYNVIEITETDIISLQPLAVEALAEGYQFVQKTIDEWKSGINTFSKQGEHFWAIIIGDEYIACGGLNQDPYTSNKLTGRVRHLYVNKKYRGLGYSKVLLHLIIAGAKKYFNTLRLYTDNPVAASLYELFGFENVNEDKATHMMRI